MAVELTTSPLPRPPAPQEEWSLYSPDYFRVYDAPNAMPTGRLEKSPPVRRRGRIPRSQDWLGIFSSSSSINVESSLRDPVNLS